MAFKIQHRTHTGHWKDAMNGRRYKTEAEAIKEIGRLDQDGLVNLRDHRVKRSDMPVASRHDEPVGWSEHR